MAKLITATPDPSSGSWHCSPATRRVSPGSVPLNSLAGSDPAAPLIRSLGTPAGFAVRHQMPENRSRKLKPAIAQFEDGSRAGLQTLFYPARFIRCCSDSLCHRMARNRSLSERSTRRYQVRRPVTSGGLFQRSASRGCSIVTLRRIIASNVSGSRRASFKHLSFRALL